MTKEATFETADLFIKPDEVSYFSSPGFISYYNNKRAEYDALEAEERNSNGEVDNKIKKACVVGPLILAATKTLSLHKIWPDIPTDYFRNYRHLLELPIQLEHLNDENVAKWLRDNMSYRTFFNMIYRHALHYGKVLYQEVQPPKNQDNVNFEELLKSEEGPLENILDRLAIREEQIYENYLNGITKDHLDSNRAINILYHIAGHPNTSSETLARLGVREDHVSCVERQIVLNPNTPEEIRKLLIIEQGIEDVNSQLKDTLDQLQKMLKSGTQIVPVTHKDDGTNKKWRWRLIDFHDNISYLYLMQEIENVEFTNNTIKNPYQEDSWNVYQPKDSVALAMWAQKVKNCVRNRESNVHNGDSEIVFIERDGLPAYTVEVQPGAPKRRNLSELSILEIQAFGARSGATRDDQGVILDMIKRAMSANV
jgi:hypothetical protein